VVKPGDTLLNVVPLSATPEIEAMMLNKDVGFVRSGQRATVKFDAFPFTRYGTVEGEVTNVSRDANQDEKQGLIYPVRVAAPATTRRPVARATTASMAAKAPTP
jgi:multidrug resistance efflux pump